MMLHKRNRRPKPLDWNRVGEILLGTIYQDRGAVLCNPGASRVRRIGSPIAWDRQAEVFELLMGNRSKGLHPCPSAAMVARRWETLIDVMILSEVTIPQKEKEFEWCGRQTSRPAERERNRERIRREMKALNVQKHILTRHLRKYTSSIEYETGMEYLASAFAERGIR
jgi:hypothetical protein